MNTSSHSAVPLAQWQTSLASAALLSLVVVLLSCGGGPASPASSTPVRTGVAFELPSDGGALVPIPQPSARVTVIDAFGPTCAPCREKLPALMVRKAEIEASGGRLVLVAVLGDGESSEDAAAALRSWGVESAFLVDRGDVLLRQLGLQGLPGAYVLAPNGDVLWEAPPDASADDVVAAATAAP